MSLGVIFNKYCKVKDIWPFNDEITMETVNSGFCTYILDNIFDGVYLVDQDRKITFWNKGAERITGFGSSEVLGRRCAEDILVHVDETGCCLCGDKCPLDKVIVHGQACEGEIFFRHKEGHRVPVMVRTVPVSDSNGSIGAVAVFRENTSNAATQQTIDELRKLALIDALTGLPNRRHLERTVSSKLDEMRRYSQPFGVLFIDIDDFKNINDSYGHEIGDKVLKMVGRTLAHNMRSFDFIGRWGGEEFVAIISNINGEELSAVAEKLRVLVEQSLLPSSSKTVSVTVSIGVTLANPKDTEESLLKRADTLMYRSKMSGKNRTTAVFTQKAVLDNEESGKRE
jgi:diguanylate cyclase (GGDEF)-like protein/PAS domain S-box-containing protein